MKAVPQGLKPSSEAARCGTAKAVPFVWSFFATCKERNGWIGISFRFSHTL